MTHSVLPVVAPTVSPETAPFWRAAAEGSLSLPRCTACEVVIWYPRAFCPRCGSLEIEWFEASGRGVVYSFTVCRRGAGDYRDAGPYVLAYVELEEGPRVMTNVIGCDPAQLRIGDAVEAVFVPVEDGESAMLRFRPLDSNSLSA